jgi:hypothetical protein
VITGFFRGGTGRPYFSMEIYFPDLKVEGLVEGLFDTGADVSLLSAADALRLGIDYTKLTRTSETQGIGGRARNFREHAFVHFVGADFRYAYLIDMRIAPPDPKQYTLPTLLGRDIVDQWIVTYDKPHNRLIAEVHYADVAHRQRRPGRR